MAVKRAEIFVLLPTARRGDPWLSQPRVASGRSGIPENQAATAL
ncbi:hypothetical protein [Desulfovibrio sp. MES5]|nr:hypothetical protein [Desulfovibrio sp. MES5]